MPGAAAFCGFAEELPPQASPVGLASSPKGTPFGAAAKFPATAKSRPLGEGGLTRSGKTEGVLPGKRLCTWARNLPAMPKAPSQRELAKPIGFD